MGAPRSSRCERLPRRGLLMGLLAIVCLGLGGTSGHTHDGPAVPGSCSVCHVSAEAPAVVPSAPPVVAVLPAACLSPLLSGDLILCAALHNQRKT